MPLRQGFGPSFRRLTPHLSPESSRLVEELRSAAMKGARLSRPPDGVRNRVIEAVKAMPEYREAVRVLGKAEMPEISEAYVRDTLRRILAVDRGLAPPDSIPARLQRAVARETAVVADRANKPGATFKDVADAEGLAASLLGLDPPRQLGSRSAVEAESRVDDVKSEVVPYLKTAAVERPIRADDTPGWDCFMSLASVGLAGPGEAAKAFTAVFLEQSETTKPAAAFFDLSGTIYEAFKEHSAKVAHARLEERAAAARAYLQGQLPG